MRVITFNANGIRSAAKKGFFTWFKKQNADVLCIQETKAHFEQLTDPMFFPEGYHVYYCNPEKKGYSGVAIYSLEKPDRIHKGLGWHSADTEGRYIQADFGKLSIASIYVPSGTSGDVRQTVKYHFMDEYRKLLDTLKGNGRDYILCGDWNIAHKPIDLTNWKANQKCSGFLPEERAWLDNLFSDGAGFVDAFRVVNHAPEQYTWWSMRSLTAWDRNVGWRIDYHVVTPRLTKTIKSAAIYRGEKFSDHAPLTIDYDVKI